LLASTSVCVRVPVVVIVLSSSVTAPVEVPEITAASLVLSTVSAKVSEALSPAVSVRVTVILVVATSSLSGVPDKIPVAESILIHVGLFDTV